MANHPIEERKEKYIDTHLKYDSQDLQVGFSVGARWGYGHALTDRAKVDDAKDAIVEYFSGFVGHYENVDKLYAALDAAKQEAGHG